jgi:peptide deformylase
VELIKFTDPALRKIPETFDFETENAKELADTLWEESRRLRGLGLSANQVGIDSKVFVMGVHERVVYHILDCGCLLNDPKKLLFRIKQLMELMWWKLLLVFKRGSPSMNLITWKD